MISTVSSATTDSLSTDRPCTMSTVAEESEVVISSSELAELLRARDTSLIILDCRPQDVYKKQHCIGAENVLPPPSLYFQRLKAKPNFWQTLRQCLRIPVIGHGPTPIVVVVDDDDNDLCNCDTGRTIQRHNSNYQRFSSFLLTNLRSDGFRTLRLEKGVMTQFFSDYQDLCVVEHNGTSEEHEGGNWQPMTIRVDGDSTGCPCTEGALSSRQSSSSSSSPSNGSPFLLPLKLKDLTLTPRSSSGIEDGCTVAASKDGSGNKCNGRNSTESTRQSGDGADLDTDLAATSKSASDRDPVNIFSTLYLGNADNASDLDVLKRHGIKYILNVTSDLPNQFENGHCSDDKGEGQFKYLRIPVIDNVSQNLDSYFPVANEFIDEAIDNKCGILIHCLAGISRSVTFTVAYLMKAKSCGMDEAYDMVKKRKPNIEPNLNFMRQLLSYERTLFLRSDGSGEVSPGSAASSLSTSSSSICVDSVTGQIRGKDQR